MNNEEHSCEDLSLITSTRRLMYNNHDWKIRNSKDTSLCSDKDFATNIHEGITVSKRHHYEPKKYMKYTI